MRADFNAYTYSSIGKDQGGQIKDIFHLWVLALFRRSFAFLIYVKQKSFWVANFQCARKKSMLYQWAVDWSAFCIGSGVDLAHACCGLNECPCFLSYLIYQTGVAVTGRILLSAIGPIADWLQHGAWISRLSSLCTVAGVVPFYLKVPKAVLPSQGLRHMS